MTIVVTGKCVAACRRAVLQWARRGKTCPLYQDGGARDVRYSSDASTGCSLAILETHCGAPSGIWRQPILRALCATGLDDGQVFAIAAFVAFALAFPTINDPLGVRERIILTLE